MKRVSDILLRIEPKQYLITAILALTLASISLISINRSIGNSIISPTVFEGFPVYSTSKVGFGNVSIANDKIAISDSPETSTRVYLYSSSSRFVWNFSAVVLKGENESTPLMFSVNWGKEGKESVAVWANTRLGWFVIVSSDSPAHAANSSVNTFTLNASLTIGPRYDASVEWAPLPDRVLTNIMLSNSTWQRSFTVETDEEEQSQNLAFISVEAWARGNATIDVRYFDSRFASFNTQRYLQQSTAATLILYASTIAVITLSILGFRKEYVDVLLERVKRLLTVFKQLGPCWRTTNLRDLLSRNRNPILILLLFACLRLGLAGLVYGHGFDLYTFRVWSFLIKERGVPSVFPFSDVLPPYSGVRPTYPYPPIIMYTLAAVSALVPLTSVSDHLFSFIVKTPLLLADIVIGMVSFVIVKKTGHGKIACLALTLSLMNILDSALWGQFDSFVVLFMILSVWLVLTDRIELGWGIAALALAVKQTALPFLPGLLVLSLRKRRFQETLFGLMTFSLGTIIIWLPLFFNGYSLNFAFQNSGLGLLLPGGALSLSPEIPGTSIDAFNIWPLITWLNNGVPMRYGVWPGLDDTLPNQLLGLSYYQFGLLLFLVFYGMVLLKIWQPSNVSGDMLKFGLLMLAFFMLPTRIHDRYLTFSISFLPLALGIGAFVPLAYVILLATFSLNLLYGFSSHVNPFGIPNQLAFLQGGFSSGLGGFSDGVILLIVIVNLSVFVLLFSYCMKSSFSDRTQREG